MHLAGLVRVRVSGQLAGKGTELWHMAAIELHSSVKPEKVEAFVIWAV
jgi:hypothetical protein